MNKLPQLLTPVSQDGLPHWYVIPHTNNNNSMASYLLIPTPAELCKLYWSLKSIKIDYAYSINDQKMERQFTHLINLPPHQRLWNSPLNSTSLQDNELFYNFDLSLHQISKNPHSQNYYLPLNFTESDSSNNFTLSFHQNPNNITLHSLQTSILNHPFTLHLQTPHKDWSGQIYAFTTSSEFYSWNNPTSPSNPKLKTHQINPQTGERIPSEKDSQLPENYKNRIKAYTLNLVSKVKEKALTTLENPRVHAGLQIAGGLGEMGLGGAIILGSTGTAAPVGVAIAAHGADEVSTGLKQLISGKQEKTALVGLLEQTGLSRDKCENVNLAFGLMVPVQVGTTGLKTSLAISKKLKGKLTYDKAKQAWISPAGLVYDGDPIYGNRVKHVMAHFKSDPGKKVHSVFSVKKNEIIGLIDEAWAKRGIPLKTDTSVYVVDLGKTIGINGETKLKIVVAPDTYNVVTAYPVK